jgi:hypothetical protein
MIHVTNWKYADIGTAIAAADMAQQGLVCKVTDNGDGRRLMTVLLDTDDALVLEGNYAIAMKVGTDAEEVDGVHPDVANGVTALTVPAPTRDREVTILAGDLIMEVRRGAKVEYSSDLLDAQLVAAPPTVGLALGIQAGKWTTVADAATGIASPVIGRVHKVFGTNVVIELL